MEYRIDLQPTYIRVSVTGTVQRPDDSIRLMQLSGELQEKHDINRFLFDMVDAEIVASDTSSYDAGAAAAIEGVEERSRRVALLYKEVTSQERVMESALHQYGYLVKVFDNQDEALSWLK